MTLPRSLAKAKREARERTLRERLARLGSLLMAAGLPLPELEHRFALPERRWRFDLAWPGARVALEVEGGVWGRTDPKTGQWVQQPGRHRTGKGMIEDMAKYNTAACRGWRVLRVQPAQLPTAGTVALLRQCLRAAAPD